MESIPEPPAKVGTGNNIHERPVMMMMMMHHA
jgi:hypothetical protein